MMREMKSKETLTSPKKFLSLAEAATKSLSVDSGIGSIGKLTDLAGELKNIDMKNITFTTLPVDDNPAEPVGKKATVVVNKGLADPLLQMIRGTSRSRRSRRRSRPPRRRPTRTRRPSRTRCSRATARPRATYG